MTFQWRFWDFGMEYFWVWESEILAMGRNGLEELKWMRDFLSDKDGI